MNGVKEAVHPAPAWRDRANFIIGAALQKDEGTEQLWARQLDERRFEICCIPFFLYDMALGDTVETDEHYQVIRVVEPSGRFVFRVWFGESSYPRDEVAAELVALGALLECSSANLLAVDAADASGAQAVANYLQHQGDSGHLSFETGSTILDRGLGPGMLL